MELLLVEDWSALWAMVRAECDVAPLQNTTRRTDMQHIQSLVLKVAALARAGEKGRALGCGSETHHQFQSRSRFFKRSRVSIYPADPEPPAPLRRRSVSGLFLSEVAELVTTTLRKMPRLSEPGLLGMRAEHWYDFGCGGK